MIKKILKWHIERLDNSWYFYISAIIFALIVCLGLVWLILW